MTNRFFAGQTNYIEEMNALDGETGDHIADTTGAHAATAISNTPAGNIAATTVQAAINELDTEKLSASATTLPASFTASSLTSVGTLTALTVSGQSSFAAGTAAAPSVKVGTGNEGLYSLAAGTLGLAASGRIALRLETVPSSVNYLYGYAHATGGAPVLRALGSDTNVSLILSSQGTGSVDVFTNGATAGQFRVNHVANSVNIIQAAGAATGGAPSFAVGGTDTNIPFAYYTKGTGTHQFFANGGLQMLIGAPASSVNYWQFFGAAAAGALNMYAGGSDTNIGVNHATKGTGVHSFLTNGSVEQFRVAHVANAVNRVTAYGNATGLTPGLFAEGSDTNIGLGLYSKAAGPVFTAVRGAVSALFDNPASPVNYATITGSATGNAVRYGVGGSDSNITWAASSKGTSSLAFYTNNFAQAQLEILHVAAAVNRLVAAGGATGVRPKVYVDGTDANIGMNFAVKGTGSYRFDDGAGVPNLLISAVTSAVNYPVLTSSATGNAVTISTAGSDSNIDFAITPKGTGVLRFGTHSAIAAETVTGYITIKDSAGNTRKLAVLS